MHFIANRLIFFFQLAQSPQKPFVDILKKNHLRVAKPMPEKNSCQSISNSENKLILPVKKPNKGKKPFIRLCIAMKSANVLRYGAYP
jgi:hypothetical protein